MMVTGVLLMMEIKFVGKSQQLSDLYSLEEQAGIYEQTLKDVFDNPRWYLDNLSFLASYRVSWKDYRKKNYPTLPYRFTLKGRDYGLVSKRK